MSHSPFSVVREYKFVAGNLDMNNKTQCGLSVNILLEVLLLLFCLFLVCSFSWSTINQDVLNYLSQEASFKSASSQRTNSYLGSEGGNLFDQSLEFQSSNDTANLRRLDLFPSYRQVFFSPLISSM